MTNISYYRIGLVAVGVVSMLLVFGFVMLAIHYPLAAIGIFAFIILCWWMALKYGSVEIPPNAPFLREELEAEEAKQNENIKDSTL